MSTLEHLRGGLSRAWESVAEGWREFVERAGDFDIAIVDDVLVVRGEKKVQREHKRGQYHIMERAYGRFELRLPVAVDEAGAAARYRRGVLGISVPRSTPVARTRRIEVMRG